MSPKQEFLRKRIVNFYNLNKLKPKIFTIKHFEAEGISKRTVYNILKLGKIERKSGSGRIPSIMTPANLRNLERQFNNKDGFSQNDAAKKYGCSQQFISKTLKTLKIKCRKKQKSPEYSEDQIKLVKQQCGWMVRNYRQKKFILDDESYFTLSKPQMPGNNIFYTKDISGTSAEVRYKFKKKFEHKVMLYIAISQDGVSEPYFKPSGLAINQKIYQEQCLAKILIPFIQKHHANDDYIFWPDKASSHYAKKTTEFLEQQNVPYVPKCRNPTNLPQCRPIEDFFGQLSSIVYKKGWKAKNTKQLKTRIRKCLKEMDLKGVQKACLGIRKSLRKVADNGPFITNH